LLTIKHPYQYPRGMLIELYWLKHTVMNTNKANPKNSNKQQNNKKQNADLEQAVNAGNQKLPGSNLDRKNNNDSSTDDERQRRSAGSR
jgi:hypothetical protein